MRRTIIALVAVAGVVGCGGSQPQTLEDVQTAVADELGAERVVCQDPGDPVEVGDELECSADGSEYAATVTDSGVELSKDPVIQEPKGYGLEPK
jgi:hypothetical protein